MIASSSLRQALLYLVAMAIALGSAAAMNGCAKKPARPPARRVEVQREFPPVTAVPVEGKIEPALGRHMAAAPEDEFIPVVLILSRQVDEDEKVRLFSGIRAKERADQAKEQRQLLIDRLKRVAQADQAQLVGFLRELEKQQQVRNVRPLWIANVVGVTAPKRVINRLTGFRNVNTIHLDVPRPVKGEIVWGVSQINADDVWSLAPTSYNGTGVVVAVLDTGVDYNHTDLVNRMWVNGPEDINGDGRFTTADNNGVDDDGNGFVDDVVGWNFSGTGSNDPMDVNGHGTHCAGTVAGDATGGSSTGVAPGARIMALRESNVVALSTEQECWDGMQYALDNGAHVVSFSSGWLDVWSPAYATWRTAVTNLMDGGVLFVTIAHNDSNSTGTPNNVRTPGRVPLALTVGATDSGDAIAGFSNNGPITWQATSPFFDYPWTPGLLKPDVSAPGVNVKSTQLGGSYTNMSGTSMACPHVSGVAALLLDKDPALTPYDLKYIIEETALDLGATGADNVFGWGRVNALDAVNYTTPPAGYDLSITGTSGMWTSVDLWVDNNDDGTPDTPIALSNNHLYARVRNLGGRVVTNAEIKFYYADVSTIGIGGFDPNGDGDPADGNFTYIGSYRVPTLGPAGSDHATAVGLVNWNIPTPTSDHWCVGVGVVAPAPPNPVEGNRSNNSAFRNFFDIITSTAGFAFHIAPPPGAADRPFGLEIVTKNLPKEARVELVLDKRYEKLLAADLQGLEKVKDALFTGKPMGPAYFAELARSLPHVRYGLTAERAVLSKIRSPRGRAIPARIVVTVPDGVESRDEMLVVVSTLNGEGKPVGGLTLNLVKGTHHQKVGPHPPVGGQ